MVIQQNALAEIVTVSNDSIPTMYEDSKGQASGIYPGILSSAFLHMNEQVEIKAKPSKRAFQELDEGISGAGAIIIIPERQKIYDFSESYFIERVVVYYNKNISFRYSRMSDLKGRKVAVTRGWSYGRAFDEARKKKQFTAVDVSSHEQGFRMLKLKRVDFVLAPEYNGKISLAEGDFSDVLASPNYLNSFNIHLAFSKKVKKEAFLKRFDEVIKEMKKSGELDKIVETEVLKARAITP